ncbi:MAG: anhydro-N-acetylmuramic acid kinase [gamma proteobacterium symbiont of Taylorina sp.]|nr:anhydro-N-acetylmuramic acid kinase [gamma proteobacterium symbiont of Taylorina sp.]
METKPLYYIGLMSGTSLDGVDVVIADINLPQKFSLLAAKTYPVPDQLKEELISLSQKQQNNELDQYAQLDVKMGRLFAECSLQLMNENNILPEQVHAIGSHGQTLRHYPDSSYPTSLQIGDPNIIAQLTQITTIADFRRRDMAAGGQGAPLVPPFHQAFFGNNDLNDKKKNRVILNIGGIANITFIAEKQSSTEIPVQTGVIGYDTGPGNGLMDNWCHKNFACDYDASGSLASQGHVEPSLLSLMLNDAYFSQTHPKSTGREYFSPQWIEKYLQRREIHISPHDILATLLELTASSISNEINRLIPHVDEVLVCGGGVRNLRLMQRLAELMPEKIIQSTEVSGLHPDWVEACAFAWLAQQTLNGLSSNLPSVTGADKELILGAIWQA